MKMIEFAKRNFKELVRDPMSIIFSIALPVFLLIIFEQFQIPNEVYKLDNFAPGIIIFSYSFISLFSGLLISTDRTSSFLTRLYASPLTSTDFILGYTFSLIPIALIQSTLLFSTALCLGLTFTFNIIVTILLLIPVSALFIALGILIGSVVSVKTAPGLSSIIVQLVAFTSGMWFDINTVSGVFQVICKILPFKYSLDLARYSLSGTFDKIWLPLLIVVLYTLIIYIIAVILFKKKMISDNK